jgi:plasmid replication initiation protein
MLVCEQDALAWRVATAIEITLSDWFFNAIKAYEVLTLHRNYFRLRKPMERRIYELARKHCGSHEKWTVRLEILKAKIGTTAPFKKFRFKLRKLVETNHLPDYKISLLDDVVTFTSRRTNAREGNAHLPRLSPETFEKAKRAAPGWDVYQLEREWREWIAKKGNPEKPGPAFIAFCRKKYRREGRP